MRAQNADQDLTSLFEKSNTVTFARPGVGDQPRANSRLLPDGTRNLFGLVMCFVHLGTAVKSSDCETSSSECVFLIHGKGMSKGCRSHLESLYWHHMNAKQTHSQANSAHFLSRVPAFKTRNHTPCSFSFFFFLGGVSPSLSHGELNIQWPASVSHSSCSCNSKQYINPTSQSFFLGESPISRHTSIEGTPVWLREAKKKSSPTSGDSA